MDVLSILSRKKKKIKVSPCRQISSARRLPMLSEVAHCDIRTIRDNREVGWLRYPVHSKLV